MGAKDSKPITSTRGGGFVSADVVPPSAALVDRKAHNGGSSRSAQQAHHQQQQAHHQQQQAHLQQQQQQQQAQLEAQQRRLLPVVIRYKGPDTKARIAGGQQLHVLTSNNTRFPMSRSDDNYFAIVELPAGDNAFKFIAADGNGPFVDPSQPCVQKENDVVNIVNVNEVLLQTKDDDDAIDDASGWGQERTVFEETRKYPPMLPPHLRYTPLNAPPTQVRVTSDGSMVPVATDNVSHLDAEHLPLPLSVTINHLYFQRREDHTITGITTRYRNKYTTVAYYRGTTNSAAPPRGSIPIPTA